MTDRISTAELRKLDDILRDPLNGLIWQNRIDAADAIAEVIELREALAEIERLASLVSNDLMGRVEASKVSAVMRCSEIACAALNHKETE